MINVPLCKNRSSKWCLSLRRIHWRLTVICVSPNGEEIARILMVTSLNDNGRYKIGDEISVSVMYSKNVMVTGSPNIALILSNNPPSDGIYQSGSGSKELVFNYIVKEGDNTLDLEYVSSTSIALNEGSIFTMDSKLLTIFILPGSQGSLSQNKDIILDGVYPTIISITPQDGNTLLLFL